MELVPVKYDDSIKDFLTLLNISFGLYIGLLKEYVKSEYLKLAGDEAKAYNEVKSAAGMSVFVVTDVADEIICNGQKIQFIYTNSG